MSSGYRPVPRQEQQHEHRDGSVSDDDEDRITPCLLGQQLVGVFFASFFGFTSGIVLGGMPMHHLPGCAIGASLGIYAATAGGEDKVSLRLMAASLAGAAALALPLAWAATTIQVKGMPVLLLVSCAATAGAAVALWLAERGARERARTRRMFRERRGNRPKAHTAVPAPPVEKVKA